MNKNKSKSKKQDQSQGSKETQDDNGHDSQYQMNNNENGVNMKSPTSTSPNRPATTAWFTSEIQHMMHGFGDCKKPLMESASLVEETVHQQMASVINKAAEVATMRGSKFLGLEDFLFLMRKDKKQLKRLIEYMSVKDMKSTVCKTAEDDDSENGDGKPPPKKKRKMCYDFLSTIDQTGELLSLFDDNGLDEIKKERLLRAEIQTRDMNTQQYLDYHESRQVSFAPRFKCQKFKDWLMLGVTTDLKPNVHAMEILSYLAYETVAQIVDLTFLVRRDSQARVDDPMAHVLPPVCVTREIPSIMSSNPTASIPSSQSATDGSQSTASPSNQNSDPSVSSSTPNNNKNKIKKKKKSGYPGWKDFNSSQALQPAEIREALRRFSQPIGPFAEFSKRPLLSCRPGLTC